MQIGKHDQKKKPVKTTSSNKIYFSFAIFEWTQKQAVRGQSSQREQTESNAKAMTNTDKSWLGK